MLISSKHRNLRGKTKPHDLLRNAQLETLKGWISTRLYNSLEKDNYKNVGSVRDFLRTGARYKNVSKAAHDEALAMLGGPYGEVARAAKERKTENEKVDVTMSLDESAHDQLLVDYKQLKRYAIALEKVICTHIDPREIPAEDAAIVMAIKLKQ